MGHQPIRATEALRAYARDLRVVAGGGQVLPVGVTEQGDASIQFSGSGAPHQDRPGDTRGGT